VYKTTVHFDKLITGSKITCSKIMDIFKSILLRTAKFTFLFILGVLNFLPILWVVVSSFKNNAEILDFALKLPLEISLKNYIYAVKMSNLAGTFLNSSTVVILSITVTVLFSFLAAYAITRFKYKWLIWFTLILALGILVPITSALLPIKIIMDRLHFTNTLYGLAILYAAIGIPISTLILRSHLLGIPKDIDEAAYMDGAGYFTIALRVIAPIARPGIITVVILQTVYCWNEFLFALIHISSQKYKTMQLAISYFIGAFEFNYGAMFAAVTLSIIPVIVIFIVFEKQVVEAFTTGSVKG
jgi:raffinose/stachyose/melibiose transport system permease protein